MGPVQQKSTGVGPQVNRSNAGFPCAVVYGLLRALPGDRALLPPSPVRSSPLTSLNASVGAPGPHDFAVREIRRSSHRLSRVHRIPPQRFVTCATPLLQQQDAQRRATDLPDGASEIFARQGLRSLNPFESAVKNSRYAQASFGAFLAALRPTNTAGAWPVRQPRRHPAMDEASIIDNSSRRWRGPAEGPAV